MLIRRISDFCRAYYKHIKYLKILLNTAHCIHYSPQKSQITPLLLLLQPSHNKQLSLNSSVYYWDDCSKSISNITYYKQCVI